MTYRHEKYLTLLYKYSDLLHKFETMRTSLMRENSRLQQQIDHLKHDIYWKDEALHKKNLNLDAMNFVWCTGNCEKGVHRYCHGETPSEEALLYVLENVYRLLIRHAGKVLFSSKNKSFIATRMQTLLKLTAKMIESTHSEHDSLNNGLHKISE